MDGLLACTPEGGVAVDQDGEGAGWGVGLRAGVQELCFVHFTCGDVEAKRDERPGHAARWGFELLFLLPSRACSFPWILSLPLPSSLLCHLVLVVLRTVDLFVRTRAG